MKQKKKNRNPQSPVPAWVRERRNDAVQHRKKPPRETYELLDEDFDDFDEEEEFDGKSVEKPIRTYSSEKVREKAAHKSHDDGKNSNPCPHYRHCGGCQLQNMTYARQLAFKQGQAEKLLGRFCRVMPIIGMEHPYHYRNKVQAAFSIDQRSRIISGIYQSSTHRIVPVDCCMIEDEKADEIICTIRKMMREFKVTAYDERTDRGFLRHVLVKRGFQTDQIMVVLVVTSPIFANKNHFIKALLQKHPDITTVLMNVNTKFTSMVLGERETVLYGPGYIEDVLCGCTFRISAKSF